MRVLKWRDIAHALRGSTMAHFTGETRRSLTVSFGLRTFITAAH